MKNHIKIPVLFKNEQAILAEHQRDQQWEMMEPSAEEMREAEIWYTDPEQTDTYDVLFPKDCIGHYHEAEGGYTRLHHKLYEISYIVPLGIFEFEEKLKFHGA